MFKKINIKHQQFIQFYQDRRILQLD